MGIVHDRYMRKQWKCRKPGQLEPSIRLLPTPPPPPFFSRFPPVAPVFPHFPPVPPVSPVSPHFPPTYTPSNLSRHYPLFVPLGKTPSCIP